MINKIKYIVFGTALHIMTINLIGLDAAFAWSRVIDIPLPERWKAWDEERLCNNACEGWIRLEFQDEINKYVWSTK